MEMVIYELINLMKLAETIRGGKTGEQKKEFVLEQINKKLVNVSDDLKDIIPYLIDYLILVDKNEIKIHPIVQKSFFKCLECFNIK